MEPHTSQDRAALAAVRLAALWRGVRGGGAVFCLVQFAVYVPGDGVRVPYPLLPIGVVLALLVALTNVLALVLERRRPRTASLTAVARRDLVLLAADTALVVAIVLLLAFEPTSAVWVLLVIPVLEAGLVGRLRWALTIWAVAVAALLLRELLASELHDLPIPGPQEVLSVLGFRVGVLLLVATVVGFQASVASQHLRELMRAQVQLAHEAGHDSLTGLATRRLFLDRAGRALRSAQHHDESGTLCLLFIDVDRFKALNDEHGHAAGDEVLEQIASRLLAFIGPQDTAARLGGDEFAVLLHRPADAGPSGAGAGAEPEIATAAAGLRTALAQPYALTGHGEVAMRCSVGASTSGRGDTLSDLLREADRAMYADKTSASGRSPRL